MDVFEKSELHQALYKRFGCSDDDCWRHIMGFAQIISFQFEDHQFKLSDRKRLIMMSQLYYLDKYDIIYFNIGVINTKEGNMSPILAQLLAMLILSACMGLAYFKWVHPLRKILNSQKLGALLLTLLTLTGGFIGSWFWWADETRAFAWDVPPLASRMLASAGWSFFVVCLIALQRPTFRRVRLVMLTLFIYLAPLAAVIFLFHLDRFDPSAPITYSFFATAIVMTVASTWYLFRPVRIIPEDLRDQQPTSAALKIWMLILAVLTAAWGTALFITDKGPSDLIWVWQGDLLSSRLIGVMLLTITGGALYSLRFADTSRQMLAMTIMYSLGLAAASLWNIVGGKPIKPAYMAAFGLVFLISLGFMLFERSLKHLVEEKREKSIQEKPVP
jgi:hypothetical protein